MKRPVSCRLLLLFCLAIASTGWAATLYVQDGTRIVGEIIEFSNGIYRIDSPVLGTLSIDQNRVTRIDYGNNQPAAKAAQQLGSVEGIQQLLMQNQALFAMIQSLQSDPQLMHIMKDPTIMNAITNGDMDTLLSNEAFMKLLQNPQIRQITRQTRDAMSDQR